MCGLPQGKKSLLPRLMEARSVLPQVDRLPMVLVELLRWEKGEGGRQGQREEAVVGMRPA